MNKYGYTLDQDERFYIDTVVTYQYAFTLFASKFVIDFVQNHIEPRARNYLMDATFDSLPDIILQIFPIFYCLMSRKTADCYEAVFKFVEKKLFKLQPAVFMTDYEDGMRRSH